MAYIMDIPSPQEIGKNIQKHRRAQKITQKEFAKRLGKSERTIQKYESGEIIMKMDVVKEVAEELNIPFQRQSTLRSCGKQPFLWFHGKIRPSTR